MEVGIQEKLAAIDAQQQTDTTNAIMGFAKSLGSMNWSAIGSGLGTLGTSISSGLSGVSCAIGGALGGGEAATVLGDAAAVAVL